MRASAVIAVSDYLRRELEAKVPAARGKTVVVDSGVDLERFSPSIATQRRLESPAFLCVGSLTERKNVVRLADAFARLGEGSLTFVGDGPLRARLEGRERVRVVGRVPHDEIPSWMVAADVVCQPSLIEPLGQSLLEAMACGRSVVATRIGGPPEFVPPEAGILVDPTDLDELERGLRLAAALPRPNEAAVAAAAEHDVRRQAARVEEILRASRSRSASLTSTSGRTSVLEPRLARRLECLEKRLARLLRVDALLQTVVSRHKEFTDLFARIFAQICFFFLSNHATIDAWPRSGS